PRVGRRGAAGRRPVRGDQYGVERCGAGGAVPLSGPGCSGYGPVSEQGLADRTYALEDQPDLRWLCTSGGHPGSREIVTMKLLRVGTAETERPALLDAEGVLR